jgi:hypothetical protein
MDIVYVVRQGDKNETLRYSLRSLKNLPHDKVFISGYTPSWVKGVISLNRSQGGYSDLENSTLNLKGAIAQPDLSDDFILMMDDVFITRPTDVDFYYHGTLDDKIASYKSSGNMGQAISLVATKNWLKSRGYDGLHNFELHFPYRFNKQKLQVMFDVWDRPLLELRPRTCYGNLYNINGQEANDAKDSTNTENSYISAGRDFDTSETGRLIRSIFTDRSPYES